MAQNNIITRIKDDLRGIWGDVADHMVDKGLEDLGLEGNPSLDEIEMVIELLDIRTLPFFLPKDEARRKTRLYSRWVKEEKNKFAG